MTMLTKLLAAGALSLVSVALGVPAQAQPEACKADIEKFCATVEKGQGRIMTCLKEHSTELSAGCKDLMQSLRKRQAAGRPQGGLRRVCATDIEKFCKDAIGKPDAMAECLRTHQKDLSDECREKVEQVLKRIDEKKAAEKKS
jgi:hypothetical protein